MPSANKRVRAAKPSLFGRRKYIRISTALLQEMVQKSQCEFRLRGPADNDAYERALERWIRCMTS